MARSEWGPCVLVVFKTGTMSMISDHLHLLDLPPFNELSHGLRGKHLKAFLSQLNIEIVKNRSHVPCVSSDVAISQNLAIVPHRYEKILSVCAHSQPAYCITFTSDAQFLATVHGICPISRLEMTAACACGICAQGHWFIPVFYTM